ncbi:hypothetical protein BX616_004517 [Lobosporangium transversale]|nr:hypothetical protein BX616_004517 [Lobosporangium transversale]
MTILKTFNDIMQEFPYVWENVILVFTGCDFKRDREILEAKQLMTTVLQQQIREHILKKLPNRPAAVNGSSTNKSTGGSTSRSTTMASFNSSSSTSSSSSSPSVSTSNSFTKPRSATTYSPSLSPVSDFDDDTVPSIPMVFLTTAENICSFALGAGKCDCDKHSDYLKVTMKRLWNEVRKTKRWVIHGDNEDDFINHS